MNERDAPSHPSPGESAGFDADVARLADLIHNWGEVSGTDALAEYLAAHGIGPSLDAKRERVILAAFDVDGAWDAEDKDGAPILWHAEAGEVLADLRTAIEALDDDQPWYSVLRDADTPISTVTTPDGQVHRPDCGAYHPDHPGTRCRQSEGHSGEHATARRDVTWDNAYLSAPDDLGTQTVHSTPLGRRVAQSKTTEENK